MSGKYRTISTINTVNFNEDKKLDDLVYRIKNLDDRREFIKSNRIVVIDNYADWCNPCIECAPRYAKLEQDFSGICSFAKENVDDKIKNDLNVRSIPCFHIYVDGKIYQTVTGADIDRVKSNINMAIKELNT